MDNNFEFDCNKYSDTEIEDILSLQYPYSLTEITTQKDELYNKLVNDENVNNTIKINITSFLNDISMRLMNIVTKGITNSKPKENDNFLDMKNTIQDVDSHFIIKKRAETEEAYKLKSTDGLTLNDDGGAPPGILNPIRYKTIKRAVNIDSRFRPNYYATSASDQHLTLPYKFDNVINMRLASIELPLTFYTINEGAGNNKFNLKFNYADPTSSIDDATSNYTITIPDGNYSHMFNDATGSSSIESIINQQLLAIPEIGGDPTQQTNYFPIRFTVDRNSGRSIFAIDKSWPDYDTKKTANELRFVITFGVGANNNTNNVTEPMPFFLGWDLGYRVNIYDSGGKGVSLVSEGICYIKGPQYIFVAIDDYNNNVNNYYISAYSDSINNKNILARINIASIYQICKSLH